MLIAKNIKTITPIEFYKLEPEETSHNLEYLKNHIPESHIYFDFDKLESERILIKYIKFHWFDHRRVWILASVWFDGIPVMIIRNAGREGDDHSSRFITNEEVYLKMCRHIYTLIVEKVELDLSDFESDFKKEDDAIQDITTFYHESLQTLHKYNY